MTNNEERPQAQGYPLKSMHDLYFSERAQMERAIARRHAEIERQHRTSVALGCVGACIGIVGFAGGLLTGILWIACIGILMVMAGLAIMYDNDVI